MKHKLNNKSFCCNKKLLGRIYIPWRDCRENESWDGSWLVCSRAPQLENDFHGNGDGGKTSQNDLLRLGPRSFGSKLMDHDGLKVSHFQLTI